MRKYFFDGSHVEVTYLCSADDLDRLLRAGIVQEATGRDRQRLASITHVHMPSGAQRGSGSYVLAEVDNAGGTFYVVGRDFTLADIKRAMDIFDQRRTDAHQRDLLERIDVAYRDEMQPPPPRDAA
jgi:hypothetical protein